MKWGSRLLPNCLDPLILLLAEPTERDIYQAYRETARKTEPRTETKAQMDLFDFRGRQLWGWTNKLIWATTS